MVLLTSLNGHLDMQWWTGNLLIHGLVPSGNSLCDLGAYVRQRNFIRAKIRVSFLLNLGGLTLWMRKI